MDFTSRPRMLPIAIQNGRHRSLPPLLLPDVSRLGVVSSSAAHALQMPPGTRLSGVEGQPRGGLESLARIAVANDVSPVHRPLQHPHFQHPPLPLAAPSAAPVRAPGSSPVGPSASLPASTAVAAAPAAPATPAPRASKRQRAGPSCDTCRLKKIKCDARIQTLWQHETLIMFNGNRQESLHVILTADDAQAVLELHQRHVGSAGGAGGEASDDKTEPTSPQSPSSSSSWASYVQAVLREQAGPKRDSAEELVRHVDKLILFQPCASCTKAIRPVSRESGGSSPVAKSPSAAALPANTLGCCSFAKGYTRADITLFSRLGQKLGARTQLSDFTVNDYKKAGY
ncbi:LADA_0F06612g1_1 [Lachancea dasiensis]|uniref:LADA_0F06612g1_1 n=1 Tax=Lachancea dasiensis TaxID=1072105 RepID=A0A1G4JKE6_9SACH|nr:LADA_0F06612g1_1 [Lachancea dasiensis]